MNKQDFIKLIQNPSQITAEDAKALESLVTGFPYCQIAYTLIAKQAADSGSMYASQKLKKAAAYTFDRKNLKRLLSQKELLIESTTETIEEKSTIVEERIAEDNTLILPPEKPVTVTTKADEILNELKENLKRLHDSKLKAAEGLNTQPDNKGKDEVPAITIEAENSEIKTEEKHATEITPTTSMLKVEIEALEGTNSFSRIPLSSKIHPLREEGVTDGEQNSKIKQDIFLDYLSYLDEKRGIFRKNKKKEGGIISKFIEKDPKIPKLDIHNLPDTSIDLSVKSSESTKGPVSENFAKILAAQGKFEKAIGIYEQLILKFPEKKAYFEAQIEKLKNKL